jgi:PIN domain nuclease of toxin-antitoxin system
MGLGRGERGDRQSLFRGGRRLRLLLDTHALIWILSADPQLTSEARAGISDPETFVAVSPVSAWEIEIKRALGKLDAPHDLVQQVADARFVPLSITLEHAIAAGTLPPHHRDPFDRMLIAQAQLEGLTIVTRDPRFQPYAVPTMAA